MNQRDRIANEKAVRYYQLGSLKVDVLARKVYQANGDIVDITGKNFRMLEVMLAASPETLSIAELHEKVWPDRQVGDDTVRQRIKLLRRALTIGHGDELLINVEHGKGYSVVASVSELPFTNPNDPSKRKYSLKLVSTVAAFLLIIVLAIFYTIGTYTTKGPLRVYVKPFKALEKDDMLLSSGFTGELIDKLVPISGLAVTGLKGVNSSGTDAIIEGSVRQDKNHLYIHVRIVNSESGDYLWVKQYDERLLSDIYEVQANIAAHVAMILQVSFDDAIYDIIEKGPTSNIDAYYMYLRGRGSFISGNMAQARREFENSLKADPEFKLAKEALLKLSK